MSATITIKNPTAPATKAQLELVEHLAKQFYNGEQVKQVLGMADSKGAASDLIGKMLAAGGTKPAKPTAKRPARRTSGKGGKATEKQISYALSLIRRGGWFDSDLGQFDPTPPTEAELRRMSARDVSEIISNLK